MTRQLVPYFFDSNGAHQPGADDVLINGPELIRDTIADLKAIDITKAANTKKVTILGYYSPGDGGGGDFHWDTTPYATINNVGGYSIGTGLTMSVSALLFDLKKGQVLEFFNGGIFTLTSDSNVGDTTITGNLTSASVSNSEQSFLSDDNGMVIKPTYTGFSGVGRWYRDTEVGWVFGKWFGVRADGTTDDSSTAQYCVDYSLINKCNIKWPAGRINIGTTGISISNTNKDYFVPCMEGVGSKSLSNTTGTEFYYTGTGSAIKIMGDPARTTDRDTFVTPGNISFNGGYIKGISITGPETTSSAFNGSPNTSTIGLDISNWNQYSLHDVQIQQFYCNIKNVYSWNFTWNNVDVLRGYYGYLFKNNSNAANIIGGTQHQNYCCIKIEGGENMNFYNPVTEGSRYGICIAARSTDGLIDLISKINIYGCYYETPLGTSISSGSNSYGYLIGKHEADNGGASSTESISSLSVNQIKIYSPRATNITNSYNHYADFFNADNSFIDYIPNVSQGPVGVPVVIDSTCSNVRASNPTLSNSYTTSDNSFALSNGVLHPINIISGGYDVSVQNRFYSIYGGVYTPTTDTATMSRSTKKITVSGASGLYQIGIWFHIDKRFWDASRKLLFSSNSALSSNLSGIIQMYKSPGNPIGSASFPIGTTLGTVYNYVTLSSANYVDMCFISFNVTKSDATDGYIYIESISAQFNGAGFTMEDPTSDIRMLSGNVSAVTSGTTIQLPITFISSDMYEVIVTPYANLTAYVTKNNSNFVITPSVNGSVGYMVIPKIRLI